MKLILFCVIYHLVFNKILKVFHFGCHVRQNSTWNGNQTTLKGNNPSTIPVTGLKETQSATMNIFRFFLFSF